MSKAIPHDSDPTWDTRPRAQVDSPPGLMPRPWRRAQDSGSWIRRLRAVSVSLALCGLAAVMMIHGSGDLNAVPVTIPAGETSVPDASAVFAGHQFGIEEPTATF